MSWSFIDRESWQMYFLGKKDLYKEKCLYILEVSDDLKIVYNFDFYIVGWGKTGLQATAHRPHPACSLFLKGREL